MLVIKQHYVSVFSLDHHVASAYCFHSALLHLKVAEFPVKLLSCIYSDFYC